MKINIVVPSTVLGGGIRVIFLYANYLTQKGHDVVVYVPMLAYTNARGKYNVKTSIANVFKRGTKVSWMKCDFSIRLTPLIKDAFVRDADITIATAWYTAPDVCELSSTKGQKVYFIQDYEIWNQKKEVVDATYRLPMHRIVITYGLQKLLEESFGSKSTVIHNGHAADEYLEGEKKINSRRCIIMLCNTAYYKGGRNGIELLKRISDRHSVRVLLFGTLLPKSLPASFEFYQQPTRSELMALYRQADICLFPSLQEAWGLSAVEAMANKCAVVGHNTGFIKELCKNREHALITSEFDYGELEVLIEQLLSDERLLARLQQNGFELVKEMHWEKSFSRFERELQQINSKNATQRVITRDDAEN